MVNVLVSRFGAAHPRQVLACRPTHLSALGWLGLQLAALWPHGLWLLRRVQDGSDDPLGIAALGLLAGLLAWRAHTLRVAPQTSWLATALLLSLLASVARLVAPPLPCALLAAFAFGAALFAWLPARGPRAPLVGLVLLALPLIASLQYYGGYPLRALTAQLSAMALQLVGITAQASGAAMTVHGRLVIVDAPCSGVTMVWMAYFCACAVAALGSLRDRVFLQRLPAVGALVLVGNVLRNSVLVALEARPAGLHAALHDAIGLLALALVCAAVAALMKGGRDGALV